MHSPLGQQLNFLFYCNYYRYASSKEFSSHTTLCLPITFGIAFLLQARSIGRFLLCLSNEGSRHKPVGDVLPSSGNAILLPSTGDRRFRFRPIRSCGCHKSRSRCRSGRGQCQHVYWQFIPFLFLWKRRHIVGLGLSPRTAVSGNRAECDYSSRWDATNTAERVFTLAGVSGIIKVVLVCTNALDQGNLAYQAQIGPKNPGFLRPYFYQVHTLPPFAEIQLAGPFLPNKRLIQQQPPGNIMHPQT